MGPANGLRVVQRDELSLFIREEHQPNRRRLKWTFKLYDVPYHKAETLKGIIMCYGLYRTVNVRHNCEFVWGAITRLEEAGFVPENEKEDYMESLRRLERRIRTIYS